MQRSELAELHYITPIANLPSIFRLGILSHHRAKHVDHQSSEERPAEKDVLDIVMKWKLEARAQTASGRKEGRPDGAQLKYVELDRSQGEQRFAVHRRGYPACLTSADS